MADPGRQVTALADLLARRIAATGPLTVAEYMADCLLHPQHGYYSTRDPFGRKGDFITAPEISQMFGELLGLCLAQSWLDQGAPARFTLAELGPGRGTLMADVLRATRAVPGFHQAAEVVLVEASATLRGVQRDRLAGHAVQWQAQVSDLPDQPLFLLANEFFDALPIHQFQRDATGWRERLVGVKDGRLSFGVSEAVQNDRSPERNQALDRGFHTPGPPWDIFRQDEWGGRFWRFTGDGPGTVVELCPAAWQIVGEIGARLVRRGGAALIIDYGNWRSSGDTLQALRAHRPEDPLASPGDADLTAHVDFEMLCPPGIAHSGLTDQGLLLKRLGIDQRAQRLAQSLSGDALETHIAAHHRLTDPAEMGTLFKALALHAPGTPCPPGFDPAPHA